MDKRYWVSGISVYNGKACANWLSSPCMSVKEAVRAIRVWVDGYGDTVSAFIREEDIETGKMRVVFAANFVNFIGTKDTTALDRFEKELEEQENGV